MSLTQVFSCEFRKISKNTFFYRTPPVGASERKFNINMNIQINALFQVLHEK